MKFCYLDESGTGDEPFAVMAGVIVDAKRMHVTKAEWDDLLAVLSGIVGTPIAEIHTRDFYPGNSPWRDLEGQIRARLISAIFDWLGQRKHNVVFTAVDKQRFAADFPDSEFSSDIGTLWRLMALHVTLALQKHHQSQRRNKGHTLLVFDNEDREELDFIGLVRQPPVWTDAYYGRSAKQPRLDQIVDVPYFGDSKHVGLIQVADFVSYFLRRHLEITEGIIPPRYDGEAELVNGWVETVMKRSIPKSMTFPARGRSGCVEFFHSLAPRSMVKAA